MGIFEAPTKAEVKERQRIWIKKKGWRGKYDYVGCFREGKAPVEKNGKYGYVNAKGIEIIPVIYEDAWNFSEGKAKVEKNGKYGYVNEKSEEVIPCIYDWVYSFNEGKAKVKKNGKWFFIDHNGNRV